MLHNVLHTAVSLRGQTWLSPRTAVDHVFHYLRIVFGFGLPPVR